MADSNVNSPLNRTGTAPRPGPGNSRTDMDDAADAALEKELAKRSDNADVLDVPFKRQWDAGLEAELEAALAGFDAANFEVASPRAPRSDRVRSGDRDRGQEGRPGGAPPAQ